VDFPAGSKGPPPQGQPGVVLVDIPASLPLGTYSVEVVAMGIGSGPGTTVNVVP
jgi:hypothetical protein